MTFKLPFLGFTMHLAFDISHLQTEVKRILQNGYFVLGYGTSV